jgi:hypothetical protein
MGPLPSARDQQTADEPVELPGVPEYPCGALAGPLADLVSSTTLPAALVAGSGLAALAGLCGKADLVMPDESLVRPVLWIPLVAPRGAGKTPSMDKAFDKLRELDAAAHEQYRIELDEYLSLKPKDRDQAAMPRDTTRRIDDATLEVVARWLANGDSTGVVESDELSGWLQSIGQYKRVSGDKGRWLTMWSATPWRYQRVGADKMGAVGIDVYIPRPVVSVVGGIQPHLHPLLGDADSGFRPRWLPHIAPLKTITWGSRVHKPSEWDAAIESLYNCRESRRWILTGRALGIWQQQCAKWKSQARGSENVSTSAALDKSDIQSARIALIIAESLNPGAGGEIPAEAMLCAVAIVQYVMNCWRALPGHESFALSKRDDILNRKVDELATWLETRDERRATRTQIKEATVAGVRKAADVDALLVAYAEVYPGSVVAYKPEGRGRPGLMVHAPKRRLRGVPDSTPPPASVISERSEINHGDAGSDFQVKPQVADSRGFSEQVLGKSVLGYSCSENTTPQGDAECLCIVCRTPLNPHLAAAGDTAHPNCA